MLEHQKFVLLKVSNDKKLFKKELVKSIKWLNEQDQTHLKHWVKENYSHVHPKIIKDIL